MDPMDRFPLKSFVFLLFQIEKFSFSPSVRPFSCHTDYLRLAFSTLRICIIAGVFTATVQVKADQLPGGMVRSGSLFPQRETNDIELICRVGSRLINLSGGP